MPVNVINNKKVCHLPKYYLYNKCNKIWKDNMGWIIKYITSLYKSYYNTYWSSWLVYKERIQNACLLSYAKYNFTYDLTLIVKVERKI